MLLFTQRSLWIWLNEPFGSPPTFQELSIQMVLI
jgi:hypothetical protein